MRRQALIVCLLLLLTACTGSTATTSTTAPTPATLPPPAVDSPAYLDASLSPAERARDLVGRLEVDELIGQMTLIELGSVTAEDVATFQLGGVLSGGGGAPSDNTFEGWRQMIGSFQEAAATTRLGIPIIYGTDAVHGHGNLDGATIFPHNIGLGAANDPLLVEEIGAATARELLASAVPWNFGPVLAVPQDPRWGRTYESFGDDPELVGRLGAAYVRGLQSVGSGPNTVFGTAKHFVGDGGTGWGTSTSGDYLIDQGVTQGGEDLLRSLHLAPYLPAFEAGVGTAMASFSSWENGKVHGDRFLLTDVLRDEMGFEGFLVSDWGGIDQIDPADYQASLVAGINAGIDMVMVPHDAGQFQASMRSAVDVGKITVERLREAVERILVAKFALGLFERPVPEEPPEVVGSPDHHALARRAVALSAVLLKTSGGTLPLGPDTTVLVAGVGADDIGIQSGGWTGSWQGREGEVAEGTTILDGLIEVFGDAVSYNRVGRFDDGVHADVGVAVIHEPPYAEGQGDSATLRLADDVLAVVDRIRPHVETLIVIQVSGRPLLLGPEFDQADIFVQAWLPGAEGAGIVDVLVGARPFTGVLPMKWPLALEGLGSIPGPPCDWAHFPRGYGLGSDGALLGEAACPIGGS